ncbi:prepilin peptidase [Clostridium sp. DL1XJH146]
MEIGFIFVLGLLIGSFLNVCIYRIPNKESIAFPPSHCTNCDNRIKPYDLIPVLSWIILRGKCRYCGEKISVKYPLIELFTGILFMLIFIKYGYSVDTLKYLILACFLIVIGFIDFNTTDVYLVTTLPAFIIGVLFTGVHFFNDQLITTYYIGAFFGYAIIAFIILVTKGMGWGDAEILGVCGIFLGLKATILTFFLSVVLGAIIGVILIATKVKGRKDYIPFGPYIALAAFVSMFLGNELINWYMGYLF